MDFTAEETNLICIFDTTTRAKLIRTMQDALLHMEDQELIELTKNIIAKLARMSDATYEAADFAAGYDDPDPDETEV